MRAPAIFARFASVACFGPMAVYLLYGSTKLWADPSLPGLAGPLIACVCVGVGLSTLGWIWMVWHSSKGGTDE